MQHLVIDTDPGIDDAQAIMMATAHPNTTVEALLTVGGNVGIEHTTRNAFAILEICEATDVRVYVGCGRALVHPSEDAAYVHGGDGLGDVGIRPRSVNPAPGHAATALVEMANDRPGELTLVTLGPLTNVAVAVALDPDLPSKFARTVSMIGAVTSRGNTPTVTAEFNSYGDPEAAHVVFDAYARTGEVIEVVDWEATMRHPIPARTVGRWHESGTTRAEFDDRITEPRRARMAELLGSPDLLAADPLAMAVVLEPDAVVTTERHHLAVEVHGLHTRGQTVVDWRDRGGFAANAEVVLEVDQSRFEHLFAAGLGITLDT